MHQKVRKYSINLLTKITSATFTKYLKDQKPLERPKSHTKREAFNRATKNSILI